MNRRYEKTPSRRLRATFAVAALLVSMLLGSGIDALSLHYHQQGELAGQPPVQLAQR